MRTIVNASCVVAVLSVSVSCWADGASPGGRKASEWKLPACPATGATQIYVTPDRHFLLLAGLREVQGAHQGVLVRFDLAAGTLTDLTGQLAEQAGGKTPMLADASLSPDGKSLLIRLMILGERKIFVKLLDTASGKAVAVPLGKNRGRVIWAGQNLLLGKVGAHGTTGPLEIVSPTGQTVRKLPVLGLVMASDRAGKTFLISANADDPTKPSERDASGPKLASYVITDEGKVLGKIAIEGKRLMGRRISSSGKMVALMEMMPLPKGARPRQVKWVIHVRSLEGKAVLKTGEGQYQPAAVCDSGKLFVRSRRPGRRGDALITFTPDGKSDTIAQDVQATTVSGDELLYLTGAPRTPVLKAIPLK